MSLLERDVLKNPATSNWLKHAIVTTQNRDPVDCLNDLVLLQEIVETRLREAFANNRQGALLEE